MTRILTIIALLFATPAWADSKCVISEPPHSGIKTQPVCYGNIDDCLKRESDRQAKADLEAQSLGFKNSAEAFDARLRCLSIIGQKSACSAEIKKYKCLNFDFMLPKARSYRLEDLKNRVDELEAEVERLRNR